MCLGIRGIKPNTYFSQLAYSTIWGLVLLVISGRDIWVKVLPENKCSGAEGLLFFDGGPSDAYFQSLPGCGHLIQAFHYNTDYCGFPEAQVNELQIQPEMHSCKGFLAHLHLEMRQPSSQIKM